MAAPTNKRSIKVKEVQRGIPEQRPSLGVTAQKRFWLERATGCNEEENQFTPAVGNPGAIGPPQEGTHARWIALCRLGPGRRYLLLKKECSAWGKVPAEMGTPILDSDGFLPYQVYP